MLLLTGQSAVSPTYEIPMRVLSTAAAINGELVRLIGECSSCQVAVAWASVGFDAFNVLERNVTKIERLVVGTHFYQTHPNFIAPFLTNPKVRFVLNPEGLFHPKVYLFEKPDGQWECVIGSPNFTKGGLGSNDEMAVLVTNQDDGAEEALAAVKSSIKRYWHNPGAVRLSRAEWEAYRKTWKRKQRLLKSLRRKKKRASKLRGVDGRAPHSRQQVVTDNADKRRNYVVQKRPDKETQWKFNIYDSEIQKYAKQGQFNLVVICHEGDGSVKRFAIPYQFLQDSILRDDMLDIRGRYLFAVNKGTYRFTWQHGPQQQDFDRFLLP
jgi:HKD family nuclease